MQPDPIKLLKDALQLPPEARAALAGSLLDSLDATVDPDAEQAWEREIIRRMAQLDNSEVKPNPLVRSPSNHRRAR